MDQDLNQHQGSKSNFLAVSIMIGALIIGGSLVYSANFRNGNMGNPTAQVAGQAAKTAASEPSNNNPGIDDDVILGDPKAGVTLIEFGDYQCPFCKKMFDESEPQLRNEYIKTGKLKMVYRDFPLDQIHPAARPAAEAAECAREQNEYWDYHDALFEQQNKLHEGTMNYVALAGELGLNTAQFDKCVKDGKYKAEVEKDYQDGIAAGVTGTPSNFIIAGDFVKFLPGAHPYENFKAAIEEALQSLNN